MHGFGLLVVYSQGQMVVNVHTVTRVIFLDMLVQWFNLV
jgi:hypothetical protein